MNGSFTIRLLVHALMYACGDDVNPASDSVNVMEEIVIEYIEQLVSHPHALYTPGAECLP